MQIGFNLPVSGPMAAPEVMANIAQLGEVAGLRLPDPDRPHRAAGHQHARLSVFHHRRVLHARSRPPGGATDHRRLGRRQDQQDPPRAGGDGRAASPRGGDLEDAGDDRRPVRRPPGRRHRRRLAEGGTRRRRHHAVRRTRRRDRRIHGRDAHHLDPGQAGVPRQIRQHRRPADRPEAVAEATPADLGRRRKRPVHAPGRPHRRRLVPDRQQQCPPAGHPAAPDRRHRPACGT